MSKKVLIIGGVAGGASAAARLRRLDENAEIILFEKGEYISFANCGLPYYIGEVIKEKEKLVVVTPERMQQRFRIDVRTRSEVIRILPDKKQVEVFDALQNKTYTETYDKLVLSPGAEPVRPNLPGIDSPRIFTLRNIPDTYRIKEFVDAQKPRRAVVVGAGFIGLEMAENLHKMGVQVTVVELADHVIGPMDFDMAAIVHQHLKTKNVEFYLKDAVKSFIGTESFINVELASGKSLKTDMVILGIGVKPESGLAREAGLQIGATGGILVDDTMRTSDQDVYAVGDAIEVKDFVSGNAALIPLAGPANKQGRIAANNICGVEERFPGTQGTSIVKVFDITVALTGNSERILKKNGIEYEKSFTHSPSHAGYYPGAIPMSIKVLFAKSNGKLLGAQIVGYDGVDKRMDVLATAMHAGMTVYDLEKLELAYAPPYSSAKDPVNIAGFTAANVLKGDSAVCHWDEVETLREKGAFLLDVRDQVEFVLGSIEGAVNIPLDDLRTRLDEVPRDRDVVIFCQVGLRGYLAYRILAQKGYTHIKNLSGGYKTYQLAVQKQSNEDIYEYDKVMKNDEIKPIDCAEDGCKADIDLTVDACGLQCPGPILEVYKAVSSMEDGKVLHAKATDPGFQEDIKVWCEKTGNRLLSLKYENNTFGAMIQKGTSRVENTELPQRGHNKALLVFSGDLDKAIAAFIIANGAASMGRKVTMFFTFWGLNILRKNDRVKAKKDFLSRMFARMMPRGSKKLSLSRMSMGGIGGKLIRYLMRKKNIASLEELMAQAQANGVHMIACNMSMDLMGIRREELLDGVTIGGVASFIGVTEEADTSLMI